MKTIKTYKCKCGEDFYEDDINCCNCGKPIDKTKLVEEEIADIKYEMKPKTIKDILEKARKGKFEVYGPLGMGIDYKKFNEFISTEVKELLEGLKGKMKDELQLNEKPEGFIGDYVKEMEKRIGYNKREQKLCEDIKTITQ